MNQNQFSVVEEVDLKNINTSTFYREFISKNRPILIMNVFETIPSLSNWSIEFLTERLANKIVKVNTSNTGIFDLNPKTGGSASEPIYIEFKEYIKRITNGNQDNTKIATKLYMQKVSFDKNFLELKGEIKFDKLISPDLIKEINLWVGPGGNTSPLHYDNMNNFFLQLYGNKKVWLYDPKQFYNLYPNTYSSKAPHISRVNPTSIDTINYPKALKTKPIEVKVSSGCVLFIPAFWWHQVYSIDTAISINIWCKTNLFQKLVPGYFHNKLSHLYNFFSR